MATKPFDFLGHYVAGMKQISASDMNTVHRAIKMLMNMSVQAPLCMHVSGDNITFYLKGGSPEWFIGRIVSDGPGSPGNYTDQRYWVIEQIISNTGEADTTDLTWDDSDSDGALWVTATNLAEVISETHDFPDASDYRVMVFKIQDQTPIPRYVFTSLPIVVD